MVSCYDCGVHFPDVGAFRHHCRVHTNEIANQFQHFMTLHPDFDGIRETASLLPESMHIVTKAALLSCAGAADTAIENLFLESVLEKRHGMFRFSIDAIAQKTQTLADIGHPATDVLAADIEAITGQARSCWETNSAAATVLHFCDAISMEDALVLSVENHCGCFDE